MTPTSLADLAEQLALRILAQLQSSAVHDRGESPETAKVMAKVMAKVTAKVTARAAEWAPAKVKAVE